MDTLGCSGAARILVVCHGNIYRSAFAGELLKSRLLAGAEVRSAGFYPEPGRRSPDRHVAMAMERGVDLSRHQSSVITSDDLCWADIVVFMDRRNWVALRRMGAEPENLVWLGAFAPGKTEIRDPYGMDDVAAELLLDRLAQCTEALAVRLDRTLRAG